IIIRIMRLGNGSTIEMYEFEEDKQAKPDSLQNIGVTNISFYVDEYEKVFEQIQKAGGKSISQPHDNTKYEDTAGNKTVYVKAPWGSLIELQTVPEGFYYPSDSEAEVFIPKK